MEKTHTTYKLLAQLSDGQSHSGEALGQALSVTRSAIWKAAQQLGRYGVEIQSTSGKGYQIPEGLELLNEDEIISAKIATKLRFVQSYRF